LNKQEISYQIPINNQIIITKKLEFTELIDALKKEKQKSVKEPYKGLRRVTEIAPFWYEAKVPEIVIKNVILPYHPRCHLPFFPRMLTHIYNNDDLVPKCGATVEETCIRLKKIEKRYIQKRSKCVQSIKNWNEKDFGHIILTQIPITSLKRHKKIRWNYTSLIHFDGSHRLMSLYYPKKIHFDYIDCFLASNDENLKILNSI